MSRAGVSLAAILGTISTQAGPPDAALDTTHAKVKSVMEVQHKVTHGLMSMEGILGTAVGVDETGEPVLVVYVDHHGKGAGDMVRDLPAKMLGVATRPEMTEKFRAFKGRPGGGGVSHTAKQTIPIQLGTSGGWRNDLANGYCCGGTLGALVRINGELHILSN